MMKKLIAMLLALTMVLSLAACGGKDSSDTPKNDTPVVTPGESEAAGSQEQEQEVAQQPSAGEITEEMLRAHPETPASEFTYAMSSNYEGILIQSYNGTSDIVVIPATIDGQPVVEIAKYCFANDSKVRGVLIPDTVIEITALFANNECVEVVVAEGVEIAGDNVFLECAAIRTIVLSDNLRTIGECAFANCTVLEKLVIPATVTEIDEDITFSVFTGSEALTVFGEAGSFIEGFCGMVGVPFVAE